MAYKEWFRRLQPIQIYLVLFFTTAYFIVELFYSYFTHSLTLLVNAYYMLCNVIALVGCIASIKYSYRENSNASNSQLENSAAICVSSGGNFGSKQSSIEMKQSPSDRRMKNTFGWARINILTMLVCCVMLGSFCFSSQVEALQTLMNMFSHGDAMHQPLAVLRIGVAGIFLNIFCYILIGGYTFHHGSSLHVNRNGQVIVKRNAAAPTVNNEQQSSMDIQNSSHNCQLKFPGRPGIRGMFRDILGCVFVVLVSILVYYTDIDQSDDNHHHADYSNHSNYSNNSDYSNHSHYFNNSAHSNLTEIITHDFQVAKFIDPAFAIVSSTLLFLLSYPYIKASGLILLQTIPNHINIDSLKKELLAAFPGIVDVHDLHVWQLTGEKAISTAHIIFLNPTVYTSIRHRVTDFFVEMGITQVTIQPEFQQIKESTERIDCLIKCRGENCSQSVCCLEELPTDDSDLNEIKTSDMNRINSNQAKVNKKFEKREIIPVIDSHSVDLKRFTLHADCENSYGGISEDFSSNSNEANRPEISQGADRNDSRTTSVIKFDGPDAPTTSDPEAAATIVENQDSKDLSENISDRNFSRETV